MSSAIGSSHCQEVDSVHAPPMVPYLKFGCDSKQQLLKLVFFQWGFKAQKSAWFCLCYQSNPRVDRRRRRRWWGGATFSICVYQRENSEFIHCFLLSCYLPVRHLLVKAQDVVCAIIQAVDDSVSEAEWAFGVSKAICPRTIFSSEEEDDDDLDDDTQQARINLLRMRVYTIIFQPVWTWASRTQSSSSCRFSQTE